MRDALEVRLKDAAHHVDVLAGSPAPVRALVRRERIHGTQRGEHLAIGPRGVRDEQLQRREVCHVLKLGRARRTRLNATADACACRRTDSCKSILDA